MIVNSDASSIPIDTRQLPLNRLVSMFHSDTGVHLEIESTEPAFQCFTGDGIDIPPLGGAPPKVSRAGVAIEPSRYVNAVNVPEWKGMVSLKKGELYGSRTRYVAWKDT